MARTLLIGTLLLGLAAPAHSTGGLVCASAGPRPLRLWLVVSHTAVPAIVSARLAEGDRDLDVTMAQGWIDPNELRLDLVDRRAMRHEARLRLARSGDSYDGSIWRNGRRRWIRCREG